LLLLLLLLLLYYIPMAYQIVQCPLVERVGLAWIVELHQIPFIRAQQPVYGKTPNRKRSRIED
jgi:hypothetical protein